MTPATWEIVKQNFDQAVELPVDERRDFLLGIDIAIRSKV